MYYLFANNDLNCFLHMLHCLNGPPSLDRDVVLVEEQKMHLFENTGVIPLFI